MNLGKYGEWLFSYRMKQIGHTVEDVTQNPNYFIKDIDFFLTCASTGNRRSFEVKFDNRIYDTHNLYLELTNKNSKQWNGEGWWKHCQADYLAYGDARRNMFYIIPMPELRQRVEQLELQVKQCQQDSTGLIVPLDEIRDLIIWEVK